ncbi:DUF3939 domain-containing protein [Bacillus xiapuensis]|uniref:DUF3939 domain-containing protein n=1 Tax=Bacillus xiapuensis TaxID=2014075 RepID=A0ABU6NCN1_9BACI|nr:DUF3939 domain-containing protein [Bacillus xiapuensis]
MKFLFIIVGIVLVIGIAFFIRKLIIINHMKSGTDNNENTPFPTIDVTMAEIRHAVRKFSDQLPKGVYRTILVRDDHSIDYKHIAPILGGMPEKNFYMSKETYDLFEECEKHIPPVMDMVQKAVDQFVLDHKEYPMLKYDADRRVNYYQLLEHHYLKEIPEIPFYITKLDGLITHAKPKTDSSSS